MNPVYRKRLPIPQIGWQVAVAMSGLISFGVIQIGQANDFTLVRSVVSSGGGDSGTFGGQFTLTATIGQTSASTMTGGGFTLSGGFLAPEPLLGDIDDDGDVDTDDLNAFVEVLIGTSSEPDFILRSDLNGDGKANGLDISLFVLAFLQD